MKCGIVDCALPLSRIPYTNQYAPLLPVAAPSAHPLHTIASALLYLAIVRPSTHLRQRPIRTSPSPPSRCNQQAFTCSTPHRTRTQPLASSPAILHTALSMSPPPDAPDPATPSHTRQHIACPASARPQTLGMGQIRLHLAAHRSFGAHLRSCSHPHRPSLPDQRLLESSRRLDEKKEQVTRRIPRL
ncbi:hypothetical protein Taro_020973 [Colocasia esculenta]|uniref:Uncharacterized protein n=1 Tax=Colocasia esculenta TaxID=4460 RepID=A0A843UXQ6_COLES|nr:hypothetical protein [Colocasia esculenta]